MATKHGNRVYIQLLLEPFRGQLLLDLAEEKGVKASALIREIAYEYIAQNVGEEKYIEALARDKQKWQEAVDARLVGRAKSRRAKALEDPNDYS